MAEEGPQVFAEDIHGVRFSYGIGQSIPKGGNGVPELSDYTAWYRSIVIIIIIIIIIILHIFVPGDSEERPSCRTEGSTRQVVHLDKIRQIGLGWHVFFDGAESC